MVNVLSVLKVINVGNFFEQELEAAKIPIAITNSQASFSCLHCFFISNLTDYQCTEPLCELLLLRTNVMVKYGKRSVKDGWMWYFDDDYWPYVLKKIQIERYRQFDEVETPVRSERSEAFKRVNIVIVIPQGK
jgi:hypothetical protein